MSRRLIVDLQWVRELAVTLVSEQFSIVDNWLDSWIKGPESFDTLLFGYRLVLLTNTLILYFSSMASIVPLVREYAYGLLTLKWAFDRILWLPQRYFVDMGIRKMCFLLVAWLPLVRHPLQPARGTIVGWFSSCWNCTIIFVYFEF